MIVYQLVLVLEICGWNRSNAGLDTVSGKFVYIFFVLFICQANTFFRSDDTNLYKASTEECMTCWSFVLSQNEHVYTYSPVDMT